MAVDPFIAQAFGFDRVILTWSEPGGDWGGFRLVRNSAGFPITETDGEVIIEYPIGYVGSTGGTYTDTNLTGGWYYYAIFLYDNVSQNWGRSAAVDVLIPFDFASTDKIWDTLPTYYKEIRDDGAGYSQVKYRINPAIYVNNEDTVPNDQLIRFLHIFGWGVDLLRTQVDSVMDGYDVNTVHVNRLALLAAQFGASIEAASPASSNRSMIRNLGWLYQRRGTLEGISELLSLVTGWDIEVSLGPNLMLSEDQANFTHPDPQNWDSTVRYVTGERAKFGLYLFRALQTAYGALQGPPTSFGNNAYWAVDGSVDPNEDRSVARVDTGDISTWQVLGPSGVVGSSTFIGQGSRQAEDETIRWTNTIGFYNTSGAAGDFTLRSVPRLLSNLAAWDKKLVIESGIPVPRAIDLWVPGRYRIGDMVMYKGSPYEAKGTTEAAPSDTTGWKRLGYDDRVRMCISYWAHSKWSGTPGTLGRTLNAYIAMFDENGDFLQEVVGTPASFANIYYDPFNVSGSVTSGRLPAKGAAWSANGVGTWGQSRDDIGGYAYPPVGRSYQLAPATAADTNVGVTYRSVGVRLIGVIFRWLDANNFWIATQTGVFKVVAGAAKANPASGALAYTAFVAGDRMRVALSGSSITVYKNGVSVGSATDSFNSTATQHGVEVEA